MKRCGQIRRSERDGEEALDHRVDLVGNLQLMEVAGADGDADFDVRVDRAQPQDVGVRVEPDRSSSVGTSQRASAPAPFHSTTPRTTAVATGSGTPHIISAIQPASVEAEALAMQECVAGVVEALRPVAQQRGVRLETHCECRGRT